MIKKRMFEIQAGPSHALLQTPTDMHQEIVTSSSLSRSARKNHPSFAAGKSTQQKELSAIKEKQVATSMRQKTPEQVSVPQRSPTPTKNNQAQLSEGGGVTQ